VSADAGETWELRWRLPDDMGRAGMQVVHIDGTIYFMGGDHDNPVIQANWPGRRNDVWKSEDKGASWELLGHAPWVPRTGQQAVANKGKVYLMGGHIQGPDPKAKRQSLATDCWVWEPKACGEAMSGWQLVTDNVWNTQDLGTDGKSDFMFEVRNDTLFTFGGDREVMAPWPQDNDVWMAKV